MLLSGLIFDFEVGANSSNNYRRTQYNYSKKSRENIHEYMEQPYLLLRVYYNIYHFFVQR